MTLTQVWGCLLILMAAPCFGAFSPRPKGDRPGSSRWIPLLLGSLPGIAVIVLSRFFFPIASPWELLGLLALVMGRYWRYKETAALAVIAGLLLHDWQITLLVGFIGFVGLSFFRQVRWGTWEIIVLVSLALIMRHGGQDGYFVAAIALSGTLAWISGTAPESYEVWSFFKPESQFRSLDKLQTSDQVGEQAARLSQLNQWGYPVLPSWLLAAGDDMLSLLKFLNPDGDRPFMVRLSSEKPSRRFHIPIEQLTTVGALQAAILSCFSPEELGTQTVLIQTQPQAQWSGITYSRPPLPPHHHQQQEPFTEVIADLITPLIIGDRPCLQYYGGRSLQDPLALSLNQMPSVELIAEAEALSHRIENQWGSPQAIEWCFDGNQLWILGVREIHHLHPVWTRKYIGSILPEPLQLLSASLIETITPQAITSIHNTFAERSALSEAETLVTHHQNYSYLNSTLGNSLFQNLGINQSKLQRLRRNPLRLVLKYPRLTYRYLRWDLRWHQDLDQDIKRYFQPTLKTIRLRHGPHQTQSYGSLIQGVNTIQTALSKLLTHSLRGQIICQGRRSLLKIQGPIDIPDRKMEALANIAQDIRNLIGQEKAQTQSRAELFAHLADNPDGKAIFQQIDQWLGEYGYCSDSPWELGQQRWEEDSGCIRQKLTELTTSVETTKNHPQSHGWREIRLLHSKQQLQKVQELIYHFVAELRSYLLAIADHWVVRQKLDQLDDIFWLKLVEIHSASPEEPDKWGKLRLKIQHRRSRFQQNRTNQSEALPLVYGTPHQIREALSNSCSLKKLQGQTASHGSAIGKVRLCSHWQQPPRLNPEDILVAPYLHETLFPALDHIQGVITAKGTLLSQGSSLARQKSLPMIIQIPNALEKLHNGQWIRLDGHSGQVELLDPQTLSITKA